MGEHTWLVSWWRCVLCACVFVCALRACVCVMTNDLCVWLGTHTHKHAQGKRALRHSCARWFKCSFHACGYNSSLASSVLNFMSLLLSLTFAIETRRRTIEIRLRMPPDWIHTTKSIFVHIAYHFVCVVLCVVCCVCVVCGCKFVIYAWIEFYESICVYTHILVCQCAFVIVSVGGWYMHT